MTQRTNDLEDILQAPNPQVLALLELLELTFKRPDFYSHRTTPGEIMQVEGQEQVMNFIRRKVKR